VPGVDVRIDDPTIQIDTSSTLYMIDSAFQVDPRFIASGGVQSVMPITIGPIDTLANAQGADRIQEAFPGPTVGCTFDVTGLTMDSSLVTMDRL
jgi:hypothetical protein